MTYRRGFNFTSLKLNQTSKRIFCKEHTIFGFVQRFFGIFVYCTKKLFHPLRFKKRWMPLSCIYVWKVFFAPVFINVIIRSNFPVLNCFLTVADRVLDSFLHNMSKQLSAEFQSSTANILQNLADFHSFSLTFLYEKLFFVKIFRLLSTLCVKQWLR